MPAPPATSITTAGKRAWSICRGIGCSATSGMAAAPSTKKGSGATASSRRSNSCDRASIGSAWMPTPISPALLQRELRGSIKRYEELKTRGRRARLPRPAGRRARSRPRQSDGAARLPAALHPHLRRRIPGHRSAAGRDPAAALRRQRGRDRLAPRPAGAGPIVPGRRSEAVDLSVPPGGRRHLPRGLGAIEEAGSAAAAAQYQLPQRAARSRPA